MVCYERLPNFWYSCCQIGHLVRDCPTNGAELINEWKLKYGSWLRASVPPRSCRKTESPDKPSSGFDVDKDQEIKNGKHVDQVTEELVQEVQKAVGRFKKLLSKRFKKLIL
ncbi:hypothetical protein ACOSP7_002289 [Xanthoceras sorbifolium]